MWIFLNAGIAFLNIARSRGDLRKILFVNLMEVVCGWNNQSVNLANSFSFFLVVSNTRWSNKRRRFETSFRWRPQMGVFRDVWRLTNFFYILFILWFVDYVNCFQSILRGALYGLNCQNQADLTIPMCDEKHIKCNWFSSLWNTYYF